MVEMGGNQGSVGTANQQVQNQHSVPDTTLNLDPETIFCLDNDHWLTIDISTLEQDVNSLYNSVFGSNGTETNNSETGIGNGNVDEQRCASPISSRGKKINSAEVPQTVESDIWGLDLDDQICQNRGTEGNLDLYYEARSPLSFWGAPMDLDMLKMDDVFQVDKADLVQGPTLAELNANDESLFNSLDYYDTLLPEGRKLSKQLTQSSKCNNNNVSMPITIKHKATNNATSIHPTTPPIGTSAAIPINTQNNYQSANKPLSSSIPATSQPLQCASLLQKTHSSMPKTHTISSAKTFDSDMIKLHRLSQNDSVEQSSVIPQLSSSAPATTGFLQDWKETPVHQKKLPTVVGHQRTRRDTDHSIHSFSSMSSLSNDEDANSEREDEENNGDCISTDNESLPGEELNKKPPSWTLSYGNSLTKSKKKKRFFWQYNIQSKGPKGPRVCLSTESLDPHILSSATDPVFSSNCQLDGVKHAGKARRGDGNDLTPNPKKLYNIGAELKKLSKIINDLTPVSELPFNSRSKSRKEKNKLASRACRLKKKAQHEANKLKLYGLQQEHKLLLKLLDDLKEIIKGKIDPESFPCNQVVPDDLDAYVKKEDPEMVAGQASEFVNKVLDKVAFGDPNGGLTQL